MTVTIERSKCFNS